MGRRLIITGVLTSVLLCASPKSPLFAVPLPGRPFGIAVNPITNRIYVAIWTEVRLSVINGDTNAIIANIPLSSTPRGVAVNTKTNRVYVANLGSDVILVIDGVTNRVTATIPVGRRPIAVAVNESTNRIFVACVESDSVFVINGDTNRVIAAVDMGLDASPNDIAVSDDTSFIYVATAGDEAFKVILPANDQYNDVRRIFLGNRPFGVRVNPMSRKVYFSIQGSGSIFVIRDGGDFSFISTILVGGNPTGLGINPALDRVYVATGGFLVVAIDGRKDEVIFQHPVGDAPVAVAANSLNGRFYVSNDGSANVSVRLEDDQVANPSFDGDSDGDGLPNRWRGKNLSADDKTDRTPYDGRFSFKMAGATGVAKELFQTIKTTGTAGTEMNLEAFSNAMETKETGGPYQVKARIFYTDKTRDTFVLNFSKTTHDWERQFGTFSAAKNFDRIRLSVIYADQPETSAVWFDGLHLWRTP